MDEALVTCGTKQSHSHSDPNTYCEAVASRALTFIGFRGNVQHEREEALQELRVVVGEMQTLAVLSGEAEGKIKSGKTEGDG